MPGNKLKPCQKDRAYEQHQAADMQMDLAFYDWRKTGIGHGPDCFEQMEQLLAQRLEESYCKFIVFGEWNRRAK